jgi:hypothetical protein
MLVDPADGTPSAGSEDAARTAVLSGRADLIGIPGPGAVRQ